MDFQPILLNCRMSQNIVATGKKKKKKEQQTDVGVNVVCTDYNSCVTLGKETFKFQDPHL